MSPLSASCASAVTIPTSSRALACVGDGTDLTSVQFSRSSVTIPCPPPTAIHNSCSMCGYSTAWQRCHLYGGGACTFRYHSSPIRSSCSVESNKNTN